MAHAASILFLCSLVTIARGSFEELKKEVFTAEASGKWKGKSAEHIPMLDLEPIVGGGWNAKMWTTHVNSETHYIAKHWVEDGEGNVVASQEFSPTDDNPLNGHKNQTFEFKVPKGTTSPLTTYAWCNMHGTWAHTWAGIELWHFQDDVKVDEHGNEVKEEREEVEVPAAEGIEAKKKFEVPQHAKVAAEEMAHLKLPQVYTVEAPGPHKGKSDQHVAMMDIHPVEGGGWIATLETNHHVKEPAHYITKHWVEDGAGTVLGVVDFDAELDSPKNKASMQVSEIHVPDGAVEPLTTYAHCNVHGSWAHTWTHVALDHGFGTELGKDEL